MDNFLASSPTVVFGLHVSEIVLLVSGFILLIGIWGEYRKDDKWKRYLVVFQVMVLVGIGGELIADAGVFIFSEKIQRLEGSDISALGQKSADARDKANAAAGAAKNAVGDASNALNIAHGARQEADAFERELRKVQKRVADRRLTFAQQSNITSKLCSFGGRNVTVAMYNSDGEIHQLSKDIAAFLPLVLPSYCMSRRREGWAVSISELQTPAGFSGIQIVTMDNATADDREFARRLAEALRAEDLDVEGPILSSSRKMSAMMGGGVEGKQYTLRPPAMVEIAIGKKP